jgi:hypothetical protein
VSSEQQRSAQRSVEVISLSKLDEKWRRYCTRRPRREALEHEIQPLIVVMQISYQKNVQGKDGRRGYNVLDHFKNDEVKISH